MEQAQKAVEVVAEGVKKVAIRDKKQKVKKEKGGDGGADAGKNMLLSTAILLIHKITNCQ